MTITRVQGNARGTYSSGTSIAVNMAANPTSGNILVLNIGTYHSGYATISSITQTGVTWSGGGLGQQIIKQAYSAITTEIWVGLVGAGANAAITVNLSATPGGGGIVDVCEYSGLLTSGFLDKTASASGRSTTPVTGTTAATTHTDELWVGAVLCNAGGAQSTPQNDFTLLDGASYTKVVVTSLAYLEKIVSATGAASSGTTPASGTPYWVGAIATFKGTNNPQNRSNLPNTMTTLLTSKMLYG